MGSARVPLPLVGVGDVSKRILLGRKLRSSQLGETLLPKRIALPVFASDALSSVAYAPDEVFIMLSLAGASAYIWSWKIAIAVALVMMAVITSYRQTVHAYPSGGGDYEVATVNLGTTAGTTVASALLVDYVLTVAVSISSGAQYAAGAIPSLGGHEATLASILVVLLAAMNLRGIRESGTFFAFPTYAFMVAILGMCGYGLLRLAAGDLPNVESADLHITPDPGIGSSESLTTFALLFLLARAFSSGCAALTGVEAISNGVPAFRKPKSRNAATTLLLLGLIAISMMVSVIVLAKQMGLRYVDPHDFDRLTRDGAPVPDGFDQHPVIAQIARAVFNDFSPGFYVVITVTGIILVLAANTAFNGFPVLGSILAKDGYAPRALGSRGDRLAYSNGIVFLAVMAIVLILVFDAETTRLIQLYIVGVFVSFNLSQLGMIRHWTRHLKTESDPAVRRRMFRSRVINAVGLTFTAVVLVIVLVTKFLAGAWITILAMVFFFAVMRGIRRHYDNVQDELAAEDEDKVMPTRVHAIVLVSKLHKPTLRALAFAKATRPNVLEAVFVSTSSEETNRLLEEWDQRRIDVPLKVLHSPYRELVRPIVEYATEIKMANPRGVVAVYIPEYVVGRWWEQLLHNQTALRLKGRLLFTPGVMVTSVPYQLRSSEIARERELREEFRVRPGDLRRGDVDVRVKRRTERKGARR
jgi:amino acid transporter